MIEKRDVGLLWEIMSCQSVDLRILALFLLFVPSWGLNADGVLLLYFKQSVLRDPQSALGNWSHSNDTTPCSWKGVTCAIPGRVTAVELPDSQLVGTIPANLGSIEYLRTLDLSNNSLNGSLPLSLFNASELRSLDLSGNLISGAIPEMGGLGDLVTLNLSHNALSGNLPDILGTLRNLTVVSLRSNYFSGTLPKGFDAVEVFDLSSNLIDGSLPSAFRGGRIRYLNISYNRISGQIPPEFAAGVPEKVTVDLSYNNLTGEIPDSAAFYSQESASFSGNPDLCGEPLRNPCPIPSTPYYELEPSFPPAIAALPRPPSTPGAISPAGSVIGAQEQRGKNGLKAGKIAVIVVGDLAGIALLVLTSFYITHKKKKLGGLNMKSQNENLKQKQGNDVECTGHNWSSWFCLPKRGGGGDEDSSGSETGSSEDGMINGKRRSEVESQRKGGGTLVTVDGGEEIEVESLLRASAYILGASGGSIMYKAVMEDGSAVAVRRIGECGAVVKPRDFEAQVRAAAKLVHPNLVRVRGFYWGHQDKLVIYDYVPNGSLAGARYRKTGSSPCHLSWEARLRIAKGVARGLAYLHDKKHVHGNLKPSNILLGSELEPKIGDIGLGRLVSRDNSYRVGGSLRNFGSNRSTASRESFPDQVPGPSPSPSPSPSSIGCASPYQAPEALRSLKPNSKSDVYSFGMVLLELLTGKVANLDEMVEMGLVGPGLLVEERSKILRMADVAIRADIEGRVDALLACLHLGFNCASQVPQRRPSMKEALQVLEKIPASFSSLSHDDGH